MIKSSTIIFILSLFPFLGLSQSDSVGNVLTEQDYLTMVLKFHPVAKQADLLSDAGESYLRKGRGGFDPKLFIDHKDKGFDDKKYYDLSQVGLKVPTWYGVEFQTGWEYAYGTYKNPEHTTPSDGLGYVGVAVNVGQGLFIDKRSATLRKAKQYQKMSENDRDNLINDLLQDALVQYWEWSAAYKKVELSENVLEQTEDGVFAIRGLFMLGELSVLDTLEAYTQLVAVETELIEAVVLFQQKTYELNNYIWSVDGVPLDVDNLIPEPIEDKVLSSAFDANFDEANSLIYNHPMIKSYQAKYETLLIEKKLAAEKIKPKLKLHYNFLTAGYQVSPSEFSSNDSRWGVKFSMPILLRKERGALQLSKIKLEQQQLKIKLKQQQILAKLNTYKVKAAALEEQNKAYVRAVKGYRILYTQELNKLEAGESSLFKLTSRQSKMFRANLKLIDLNLKLIKAKVSYIHSSGTLYLSSDIPVINNDNE